MEITPLLLLLLLFESFEDEHELSDGVDDDTDPPIKGETKSITLCIIPNGSSNGGSGNPTKMDVTAAEVDGFVEPLLDSIEAFIDS